MLAKFIAFLRPTLPESDDEESLKAEILGSVLNAMLVGTVVLTTLITTVVILRNGQLSRLVGPGLLTLLILTARELLRRGGVRLGSWLYVIGSWLVAVVAVIINGGILAPSLFAYNLVILVAALLLGPRPMLVFTGLGIVISTIAAYLASRNPTLSPDLIELVGPLWAAQVALFLLVSLLIGISTHLLQSALMRARAELAERRRVEEQLREAKEAAETAHRVKSTFLMTMSHELRTPLNAIIGFSDLLLEQAREEQRADYIMELETIRDSGKHLEEVFQDILDMSHIEAERIKPEWRTVAIREVVAGLEKELRPLLAKSGNQLTVRYEADIQQIRSDPEQLRQALWKVLHNADKFTQKGSITLEIDAEKSNGGTWMNFRVSDTGIGIPPERLPEIGKPFVQVDGSSTRHFGGTGLGLAISRGLCELLGGELLIASEVGRGSTFTIRVPG